LSNLAPRGYAFETSAIEADPLVTLHLPPPDILTLDKYLLLFS